jgi:L-malate glycosyltransferase
VNILYLMDSYNIYGGTPKKTLDLMKFFGEKSYLYVYDEKHTELKYFFEETNAHLYDGFYGKNLFKHIRKLLQIIDKHNITIVQTQFSMGEILGYFIKLLRPHIKLVIAFVGSFAPGKFKKFIVNKVYKTVDTFIYISEYVKKEKINQFPILVQKTGKIIFNGTEKRNKTKDDFPDLKSISLLDVAGLVDYKNINILIDAMQIILHNHHINNIYLYIVGDGNERENLEKKIKEYKLDKYVILLGYQKNIGALLNKCDIFVHPAFAEGFGIAIAEAMLAEKPIIVADAGALPELIDNEISGLVLDPFDANAWADAIVNLANDKKKALNLAKCAKDKAMQEFSIEKYTANYEKLYKELLSE